MNKAETYRIAVLLTVYNRKQKTLDFLASLTNQLFFKTLQADIYLLDDGSTDGTASAVAAAYPFVKLVTGSGSLFWAGGMRTIWQYAIAQQAYNLFLLFNDDVVLFDDAIERLISCYQRLKDPHVILVGSTLSPVTKKLSYGGHVLSDIRHSAYHAVPPDDNKTIPCHLGNANVLLVDEATVNKIGIFSEAYTHYFADYDYTVTAVKANIAVLIAPGYYAYCEDDHGVNWVTGKSSLRQRIKYLYNPKGLAYHEYLFYIKKHFPADYFPAFVKIWLKTFFPVIWDKFKKTADK